jgi:S-adenosylmethionine decarboxylase
VATGKEMTKKSGISLLCPGALIDETSFTPCGYSMNAILHDSYYTVHITPEEACSYASFETNACLTNYSPLVRNALSVFRPKRFVVTMFGDETGIHSMTELPTDMRRIDLPGVGSFVRTSQSNTKIATECCCFMAVYTIETATTATPRSSNKEMSRETSSNSLLAKRPRGYSVA